MPKGYEQDICAPGSSEVLMRAYLEWDTSCVERFDGVRRVKVFNRRSTPEP